MSVGALVLWSYWYAAQLGRYWVFGGTVWTILTTIIAMSAEATGTIEADSCDLPILNFKYCPHCGAKMDIKEE